MTTKPELKLGSHLVPGLAAALLFVVMLVTFVSATFGQPTGFPGDANITASIGYAMFDLPGPVDSESFLVAFEIIDLVLVAALAGAVLLARRERGGAQDLATLLADGGRELRRTVRNDPDENRSEGGDE